MHPISAELERHYSAKFSLHGPCSEGVDWGSDEANTALRYEKMLAITAGCPKPTPSLLDVGCGYGGLYLHSIKKNVTLDYSGIDAAESMIQWAKANIPSGQFIHGDMLEVQFDRKFDYLVCNGILTQKLEVPTFQMDLFAGELIRRMFDLCNFGIALNMITTKVNYFSNNLYYRDPVEMLSWCLSEITAHVKLDHAYPLYEYTVYLYREPLG